MSDRLTLALGAILAVLAVWWFATDTLDSSEQHACEQYRSAWEDC